jgi:3-phosphoshikimate 1-carboxyvinyltransferase
MPAGTTTATITPARRVRGRLKVPGDKSISHRYAMLAALADGHSRIEGYAPGADCAATLACLRALGTNVTVNPPAAGTPGAIHIEGRGVRGLQPARDVLDARNSGTTMRLLSGVLAAHSFVSRMDGDASLRRRPMRRVIVPLERMGARIGSADGRPPLEVHGAALHGIDFAPDEPSAQVKSAVLLAGLQAGGMTRVTEPAPTRDHTERAFVAFGVELDSSGPTIALQGGQRLTGGVLRVPGDPSSAAFWMAAAAALPGSEIEVDMVGLNPTRTAFVEQLRRFGAQVDLEPQIADAGEPIGLMRVRHAAVRSVVVAPAEVPGLIDELPVLAALATHGGELTVTGAAELRAKESDRITALVSGLRALGADADELPDGFHVRGAQRLRGGTADAAGDHRLAMSFAIAALGADGPSTIGGADAVDVSYPGFFEVLDAVRA